MTNLNYPLDFPHAYGKPELSAVLKSENSHFIVHEHLGFSPCGEGEHWYVHLESDGENTQWLAEQMAKALGVKTLDIGYCGLKDRNAITRQWFSVYDPKQVIQDLPVRLEAVLPDSRILECTRGQAKLRRGMHAGNGFVITLVLNHHDLDVESLLLPRLLQIKKKGVPNYFGLQRFGRNGNNLREFDRFLVQQEAEKTQRASEPALSAKARGNKKGRSRLRKPKSIVLSSARSYLFNCVLAERVKNANWQAWIEGDVPAITRDTALPCDDLPEFSTPKPANFKSANQSPTAPLWGRGRSHTSADALIIEQGALLHMSRWANALEHLGLSQERRNLCSMPQDFLWHFDSADKITLRLIFSLPPGEYATGILREICDCVEPERDA